MNNAIHTENLVKRFRKVEALRGLNLTVPEGSIYALVGPNGAGKTTVIKILMNIFKTTLGYADVMGRKSSELAGRQFTGESGRRRTRFRSEAEHHSVMKPNSIPV